MSDSFVQLVAAMRQAQIRYFKDRTQSALRESKRLEQQVDTRLAYEQAVIAQQLPMEGLTDRLLDGTQAR